MALSPKHVKYMVIGVLVVVVGIFALSLLWQMLKIAVGVLIGLVLIYLGVRFMLGKGLPKKLEKAVNKALEEKKDKNGEGA